MNITKKTKIAIELHAYAPELNRLYINGKQVKSVIVKTNQNVIPQHEFASLLCDRNKQTPYTFVKKLNTLVDFQF